jgi:hypothetical protein
MTITPYLTSLFFFRKTRPPEMLIGLGLLPLAILDIRETSGKERNSTGIFHAVLSLEASNHFAAETM